MYEREYIQGSGSIWSTGTRATGWLSQKNCVPPPPWIGEYDYRNTWVGYDCPKKPAALGPREPLGVARRHYTTVVRILCPDTISALPERNERLPPRNDGDGTGFLVDYRGQLCVMTSHATLRTPEVAARARVLGNFSEDDSPFEVGRPTRADSVSSTLTNVRPPTHLDLPPLRSRWTRTCSGLRPPSSPTRAGGRLAARVKRLTPRTAPPPRLLRWCRRPGSAWALRSPPWLRAMSRACLR